MSEGNKKKNKKKKNLKLQILLVSSDYCLHGFGKENKLDCIDDKFSQ